MWAAFFPWRWATLGALVAALLIGEELRIGVLHHKLAELTQTLADERQKSAEEQAHADRMAREAEAQYRETEARLNKQLEDARNARIHDEMVNNRRIAVLQRERGQLLDSIKAFAGGGDAASDSLSAARARADTLGQLLAEALRTAAELAEDAEREAGDARQLRQSWPQGK